jgi:pyrroline-5-carboxylate reductase
MLTTDAGLGMDPEEVIMSIAFVGGGRVTRILLGGWCAAGAVPPDVLIHDPDDAAIEAARAYAPAARRASLEESARAGVVFLALHPPAIAAVLAELRPRLAPDAIVVSLAPKVTLGALAEATGTARVARMIPNAPSLIGRGYNPVAFGAGLDEPGRTRLEALFRPWGQAPVVAERDLEAYAILSGMGPTYLWFQWQALREISQDLGLEGSAVDAALSATVTGALATLLDSGLEPRAVMDLVPVKPLAAAEPRIVEAYREALPSLHAKIRSVPPAATAPA